MENETPQLLSLEHNRLRDIWNHTRFLVTVAYDWEWAITQFKALVKEAPNCLIKAILLLNIGITYSLSAEYQQAERAFHKALSLHPLTNPLTHFLLGLVRFELTNYAQAQISFKLCAYVLRQTNIHHDYRPLGLDFVLSHDQVVENEEISAHEWTLKQKERHGGRLLNRLPASSIFGPTVLYSLASIHLERELARPTIRQHVSLDSLPTNLEFTLVSKRATNGENSEHVAAGVVPRTSQQHILRKQMVPRAAQSEAPDLRSLAQFLKYTGPGDLKATEGNMVTQTVEVVHVEKSKETSQPQSSVSIRQTGSNLRQVVQQKSAQRHGLLRKFSTRKLER